MTALVARAPGKVVLTGDYAVLCGAPAIVAAIDRYAEVRLDVAADTGPLSVESLVERERWTIAAPDGEELTGGDLGAVLAAQRAAAAWVPALAGRGADIVVDARPFLVDGRKLGVGRSAAVVTAAVAAWLAVSGRRDRALTCEAAVAAHALFQEGHGSGADVAAAAHGGVIEFRRSGGRLAVTPRVLPPGLELLVGWTGEPARTDPLVKHFSSAAATREPPALRALIAAAEEAARALAAGDAAAFCATVTASAAQLARLGAELGMPIVTPPLTRLVDAAAAAGAVAKPSGAGGGDCGVAFCTSAGQAEEVRAAWRDVGIVPLPVTIASAGVVVEETTQAREAALG
ncbi:MAG TPA: hypothetical protein VKU61_07400 [Candidatus Binatia bacterium]|nr:hypothetical protein [Candidatus Binatia bacterium]